MPFKEVFELSTEPVDNHVDKLSPNRQKRL